MPNTQCINDVLSRRGMLQKYIIYKHINEELGLSLPQGVKYFADIICGCHSPGVALVAWQWHKLRKVLMGRRSLTSKWRRCTGAR